MSLIIEIKQINCNIYKALVQNVRIIYTWKITILPMLTYIEYHVLVICNEENLKKIVLFPLNFRFFLCQMT